MEQLRIDIDQGLWARINDHQVWSDKDKDKDKDNNYNNKNKDKYIDQLSDHQVWSGVSI